MKISVSIPDAASLHPSLSPFLLSSSVAQFLPHSHSHFFLSVVSVLRETETGRGSRHYEITMALSIHEETFEL